MPTTEISSAQNAATSNCFERFPSLQYRDKAGGGEVVASMLPLLLIAILVSLVLG
jgi:hypothetical protein